VEGQSRVASIVSRVSHDQPHDLFRRDAGRKDGQPNRSHGGERRYVRLPDPTEETFWPYQLDLDFLVRVVLVCGTDPGGVTCEVDPARESGAVDDSLQRGSSRRRKGCLSCD
jgi:hypothetical protein